jgi:hypothetical protein
MYALKKSIKKINKKMELRYKYGIVNAVREKLSHNVNYLI